MVRPETAETLTPVAGASAPEPAAAAAEADPKGKSFLSVAVFAAAAAFQRGIMFALIPLFTRAMSPAEYGALSVMLSVSTACAIFFAFGMDLAIFRTAFQLEDDSEAQNSFYGSVWRFLLVAPICAAVILGGASALLIGPVGLVDRWDLLLAPVSGALLVAATNVPLGIVRARQELRKFVAITGVAAVATGSLTALFVVVFDWGITGWLAATCVANVATFLCAARVLPWPTGIRFDRVRVRSTLLFGLPLIPHFMSQWALQLADRLVLAGIVATAALGVFSLASNLAIPVLVLVQSISQGVMPLYARAGATDTPDVEALSDVVLLQAAAVFTVGLGGALLLPPIVTVAAPDTYSEATILVPWIVLGYIFLGLYYIPMNIATLSSGRGRWAWVATLISAATNIALILIFTPSHGVRAAAVASAAGYLVLLVAIAAYAARGSDRRLWPIGRLALMGLATAAIYAAAAVTVPVGGVDTLVLRAVWLVAGLAVAGPLLAGPAVVRDAVAKLRRRGRPVPGGAGG